MITKPLELTIKYEDKDGNPINEPEQIERFIGNHFDRVIKAAHCITQLAQAKSSLAKTNVMQDDIDEIKDHLGLK